MKNAKLIFISLGLLIASFNANAATCSSGVLYPIVSCHGTLNFNLVGTWTFSSGGTWLLQSSVPGVGSPGVERISITDPNGVETLYIASFNSGFSSGGYYNMSFSAAGSNFTLIKSSGVRTLCIDGICQIN